MAVYLQIVPPFIPPRWGFRAFVWCPTQGDAPRRLGACPGLYYLAPVGAEDTEGCCSEHIDGDWISFWTRRAAGISTVYFSHIVPICFSTAERNSSPFTGPL